MNALSPVSFTLPSGHTALIDAPDYLFYVAGRRWHAIPARDTHYVQSGDDTSLLLHRLVMKAPAGVLVDHINRDGLDNRRVNLRLCNQSQNKANRPAPRNNTSGYKGVHATRSGRWAARITIDYRAIHLGTFDDAWAAAEAYNAAALAAWGAFALLNTPISSTTPVEAAASTAPYPA